MKYVPFCELPVEMRERMLADHRRSEREAAASAGSEAASLLSAATGQLAYAPPDLDTSPVCTVHQAPPPAMYDAIDMHNEERAREAEREAALRVAAAQRLPACPPCR